MAQQPLDPRNQQRDLGSDAATVAVDPAQESLSRALRSGFNVLRVLMIVLLVAYVVSGWFQVQPGEQGIIVRFGALRTNNDPDSKLRGSAVFGPGGYVAFPDPFDEKIRITGQILRLRIDSFCFLRTGDDLNKALADVIGNKINVTSLEPGIDGYMITGDRNIAHGAWIIEYQIDQAEKFVRNLGEDVDAADGLLRRLAEDAIVRTVAALPIEEVTRTNISAEVADFPVIVKRRLGQALAKLDVGITINNVIADTIEPGNVREAFLRVANAESDKQTEVSKARQAREKTLNETAGRSYKSLLVAIDEYGAAQTAAASGERLAALRAEIDNQLEKAEGRVATMRNDALARAAATRHGIRGDYERFEKLLELYRQNPKATRVRLWSEMREAILSSKGNEVFYVPLVGAIEIITNRDMQRQIEAEKQRYRSRLQQP